MAIINEFGPTLDNFPDLIKSQFLDFKKGWVTSDDGKHLFIGKDGNVKIKTFQNPYHEWSTPLDLAEDFNDSNLKNAGFKMTAKSNIYHSSGGYRVPVKLDYTNDIINISIQEDGKRGISIFMNYDNSNKTNIELNNIFDLGGSSSIDHEFNIRSEKEFYKKLNKFISESKRFK